MKVNQAHPIIMWLLILLIAGFTLFLLTYLPTQSSYIFLFHWAALLIALLLVITPLGSQRLSSTSDVSKRLSPVQWWLKIIVMQLSLIFLLMGSSWLLDPQAFASSLRLQLVCYGLYPWGFVAIVAITFGRPAYQQQQDCYMHTVVASKHVLSQTLISIINTAAKLCSFMAWCSTLLLVCIIWAKLFIPQPFFLAQGFNLATIVMTLALVVFSFSKPFKKLLKKLFAFKNPTSIAVAIACIGITLALIVLSILVSPLRTHAVKVPSYIHYFMQQPPATLWRLFSLSWWFSWSYLLGIFIARISKGYRVRMVAVASLSLPLLLALLLHFAPMGKVMQSFIPAILATLGFVALISLFMNRSLLPAVVMTSLSPAELPRHRDHHFLMRKLLQGAFIIAYFFLTMQLSALYLILFATILPGLCLIPFVLRRALIPVSAINQAQDKL